MCTICTQVQICTRMHINLHHLESKSKSAFGCKFAPGSKLLKHRSHGQKYTLGANCAHERGLKHKIEEKSRLDLQKKRQDVGYTI